MKKLIITLNLFFIIGNFSTSKAQNILPDVGSVLIDSTLNVRDTAVFKSRVTIDDKLLLKNGVRVWETARFEDNLRVMSTARMDKLVVDGNAVFKGNVKMDSIGVIPNAILNDGTMEFLVVLPNGQVKRGTVDDLINIIYKKPEVSSICDNPSGIENPIWENGFHKLFTRCAVNVGVGTADPAFNLDIRGYSYTEGLQVGHIGGNLQALINGYTDENKDLIRLGGYSSGTPEVRFKIKNDGTVYVKELRVRHPNDFPDYVFDANYKLMSLYELEKYIKKYKKLPKMPSAEKVKNEGANVGEIQLILVEKVEELTLYNIELKKQNDNLQNEINQLKIEVEEIKKMINK